MNDTKEDFRCHLTRLGFELGASRDWIVQKLKRYVGEARSLELHRLEASAASPDSSNRIYDAVRNMTEANLLRSANPDVTVETAYHLYQLCKPYLGAGKRVAELACWTGGLASFIASNHPQTAVYGVDRVQPIIGLSRQYHRLENLQFFCWDYRGSKPSEIPPADVVLCGLGINNSENGDYDVPQHSSIREAKGYRRHKIEAAIYFKNWREACKDEGILIAVLRMSTFGRFLAFLDAAQETGWAAHFQSFGTVVIGNAGEAIPCLFFYARPSDVIPEDAALAQYVRLATKPTGTQIGGPMALAVHRTLANREVLETRTFLEEGIATHEEVGISGQLGYLFRHDAKPDYRIVLTSVKDAQSKAERLRANAVSKASHIGSGDSRTVAGSSYLLPATGIVSLPGFEGQIR